MALEAQMAVMAVRHSTTDFQRQRRLLIIPYLARRHQLIISKATNHMLLTHPKRTSVPDPQLRKTPLQSIIVLPLLYFLVRIAAQLSRLSGGEMKAAERYVTPAVRVRFQPDPAVADSFQGCIINFTAYTVQWL